MSSAPPPVGYPQPGMPPQSTTNVWAIISLITGILGCLLITPLIAIVTGVIGVAQAKPPKGGKGMAIAGIILGVIWIAVGIGGYIATRAGVEWVQGQVSEVAKQPTIDFLNALQQGEVDEAGDDSTVSDNKLQALSAQLKPLGECKDVNIGMPSYKNNNGVVTLGFTGTATFENGTRDIVVEIRQSDGEFVFEKLELQ